MDTKLTEQKCVPCEGGVKPLDKEEAAKLGQQLNKNWVIGGKKISRRLKFKNFLSAIKFVNDVAVVAEQEDHHPDLCIYFNEVKVDLWTHAIGGLSDNDFILAAKIDEII